MAVRKVPGYYILSYVNEPDKVQQLNSWVLKNIQKKECVQYIRSPKSLDKWEVCFCGYLRRDHREQSQTRNEDKEWNPEKHVQELPTDAYGFFTFKGDNKDIKKVVEPEKQPIFYNLSNFVNCLNRFILFKLSKALKNLLMSEFYFYTNHCCFFTTTQQLWGFKNVFS